MNGDPFFPLGVYFEQSHGGWYSHPNSWNELASNGFNVINLLDGHQNALDYGSRSIISADSTDLPWLSSRYDNPQNAQEILTGAVGEGLYIIADHTPFIPDGGLALNGVRIRDYGDPINQALRETIVDNLVSGWPQYGVSHDAFLGWGALDEPIWFWGPYEPNTYKGDAIPYNFSDVQNMFDTLIQPMYQYIKARDPDHIVVMNFAPAHGSAWLPDGDLVNPSVPPDDYEAVRQNYIRDLQLYSTAADVVQIEVLAINESGYTPRYRVFDNSNLSLGGDYTKLLVDEISQGQKPAWMELDVPYRTNGSYSEFRFLAYQAIVNGAGGLFWFGWHAVGPNDSDWLLVKELVRDELSTDFFYPVLTAHTSSLPISVDYVEDPTDPKPDIEWLLKEYAGYYYLMAVNRSPSATHHVTFGGFGSTVSSGEVLFESRNVSLSGGTFTDAFAPMGQPGSVHVYRIFQTSGTYREDVTWGPGMPPISGDITIPSGVTLTISPGTEVRFAANSDDQHGGFVSDKCELIVEGTLDADGVTFRSDSGSPANSDWQGIRAA